MLVLLRLLSARAREPARFDERQCARQILRVKPGAVLGAHVDDDAAGAAEPLSVHQRGAHGAGDVADAQVGRRRARRHTDKGEIETVVALDQIAKGRVLDELGAAAGAVVQRTGTAVEGGHQSAAIGTHQHLASRDGLETEVSTAPGAMDRIARVQVKAGRASHRGHGRIAVDTATNAFADTGAARGAKQNSGDGHGWILRLRRTFAVSRPFPSTRGYGVQPIAIDADFGVPKQGSVPQMALLTVTEQLASPGQAEAAAGQGVALQLSA
jgi:hypothetical protein